MMISTASLLKLIGQSISSTRFAVPLYLHTISLLVPPVTSPKKATTEELCRGL
jgi:hypothetical protein